MRTPLRNALRILIMGIVMLLAAPSPSSAREQFEEPEIIDARLEGYGEKNVNLPQPGTTALTWLLFVFLGIVGCGVMFKDAKRTHLD